MRGKGYSPPPTHTPKIVGASDVWAHGGIFEIHLAGVKGGSLFFIIIGFLSFLLFLLFFPSFPLFCLLFFFFFRVRACGVLQHPKHPPRTRHWSRTLKVVHGFWSHKISTLRFKYDHETLSSSQLMYIIRIVWPWFVDLHRYSIAWPMTTCQLCNFGLPWSCWWSWIRIWPRIQVVPTVAPLVDILPAAFCESRAS